MLRSAAESLIRGQDGDVSLGWDLGARRRASVLCFDEMQVTDPFAAVALKGELHTNFQSLALLCLSTGFCDHQETEAWLVALLLPKHKYPLLSVLNSLPIEPPDRISVIMHLGPLNQLPCYGP